MIWVVLLMFVGGLDLTFVGCRFDASHENAAAKSLKSGYKMITTDNVLPDWISKQATLGQNISLEVEQTEENALRYLLSVCCPQIFESYAIVLSPFWINWKVKELVSSGLIITEIDESDFKRLSWRQFFNFYDKDFEISTADQTATEIKKQFTENWPPYLWFPGEGNCETEELNFILNKIADLYGDTIVNYYYCLLKTQKWEGDIFYRGLISEVDALKDKTDIRDNPILLDIFENRIIFSILGMNYEVKES